MKKMISLIVAGAAIAFSLTTQAAQTNQCETLALQETLRELKKYTSTPILKSDVKYLGSRGNTLVFGVSLLLGETANDAETEDFTVSLRLNPSTQTCSPGMVQHGLIK